MEVLLFRGSTGLNTKDDPARHGFTQEAGEAKFLPLTECKNVVVRNSGRLDRVKGYTKVASGDYRDLFSDGGDVLVVKDDVLCVVNPDYSVEEVADLNSDDPVAYCQTDIEGRIYWCNGVDSGYVKNRINHDWVTETPFNDDTRRDYLDPPPQGHILEYQNGMVFVASDNAIYHSDFGMPGLFFADEQFFFYRSRIRMMRGVGTGLWVGDGSGIYFINNVGGETPQQVQVADYPAIEGTSLRIYSNSGPAVYFWSTQGACMGLPTGEFKNITYDKLEWERSPYPLEAIKGASVRWGQFFITTFEG
jgi:hypothetical protein